MRLDPQFDFESLDEKLRALAVGNIKLQGRGRPKKGSTTLKLKDLGWTRQQVHEFRKIAQIPDEVYKAFAERRHAEGKGLSRRSLLIHCGLKNVVTDDIFVDTPLGDLAEHLLEPTERVMREMNDKQRRWLLRALRHRLKTIAVMAEVMADAEDEGTRT